jgi:hypothetical protein
MLLDQVLLLRTACASKLCFFLNQFMLAIAEGFWKKMLLGSLE